MSHASTASNHHHRDAGDDDLFGTVGNDVIDGLEGNDQIFGGDGSDWVTSQGSLTAVEVFLGPTGFGSASGGYGDDNLSGIENVVGSNFDDIISASSSNPAAIDNIFNGLGGNDTLLFGGRGNDTLYGGDGQDSLYGQQGDDVIDGENGNDFMRGGTGNDTLTGGSGFDRVSFFPTGSDTVTSGVTVSLLLQGVAQDTGQGLDTLNGIEALSGTPFNDSLTGDGNVNWLVSADSMGRAATTNYSVSAAMICWRSRRAITCSTVAPTAIPCRSTRSASRWPTGSLSLGAGGRASDRNRQHDDQQCRKSVGHVAR